jgi:hypothetical protein
VGHDLVADVPEVNGVVVDGDPFVLLAEVEHLVASLFEGNVLLGREGVAALPEDQTAASEDGTNSMVFAAVCHR